MEKRICMKCKMRWQADEAEKQENVVPSGNS